jgi:hypothetical protein
MGLWADAPKSALGYLEEGLFGIRRWIKMATETLPSNALPPLWPQIFGIIDQPGTAFAAVTARSGWGRWALPLLIWLLAFGIAIAVQAPYMLQLSQEMMESQLAAMPPEQAESVRAAGQFTVSLPFILASSLISGLLFFSIGLLVQAAFLYFGAFMLGGAEINFSSMFTMIAWTRIPMAIAFLVQAGYVALTQQAIRYPGLSFLMTTGEMRQDVQNPLFSLLGSIEFFWLWQLLLTVIGLTVISRLGWGKALLLTLVCAALVLGVVVLPAFFFPSPMA